MNKLYLQFYSSWGLDYRVLFGFTVFYRVLPGFSLNRWNKNGPLPSFTEFFFKHSNSRLKTWIEFYLQFCSSWGLDYRVLPSFTGFYRVLPSFTEFYRVLPRSFTEFYRVLPNFTELFFKCKKDADAKKARATHQHDRREKWVAIEEDSSRHKRNE